MNTPRGWISTHRVSSPKKFKNWAIVASGLTLIATLCAPVMAGAAQNASNKPAKTSHPKVSADGPTGMDLTDAWNLTAGDPNVTIAYIEGGINWHLGNSKTLDPNIYVNWHELPVPCTGTSLATATMVISGQTEACKTVYTSNSADYDVNQDGMINALDWSNDPRVTDSNGNGYIDPEDLIAAFSNNVNNDGSAYPNDISGWDFYDNNNDPATTDTAYGHSNGMMGVIQHECPRCMILPIKAGEEALDATDRLAQAWLFAAEQGARVIVSVTADLGYSTFMAQTIAYLHSKGIVMVESSNDFDSPDHQGGMFWPYVIPGNGAVATQDGTAWTRSDLTSWGTKAMFTVPTGGGSTSESTPTTGGAIGLLLSYGDLAAQQGLISKPLDGPEALQILRATATPITDPSLPWPGSPGEWNPQYGYGMPQLYKAMLAVQSNSLPPVPYISSPDWYTPIDPTITQSVPVTGTVETSNGASFSWQIQYGLGGNPTSWTTFGTGNATGSFSGTFGTLDTSQIPSSFWSAKFSLSQTKELETVDQYSVTFRVVVTDSNNQVGEDRRAVSVFHDPTALPGFPMQIGSSGESQPALVDLQGTGKLDIVFATSDGYVDALDPSTGKELPGWPAHTNALNVLGSYPGVNPGYEPVIAPVAVGDLLHTGNLDVVVTSMDGNVYVFDSHGNLMPGWPQALNYGVQPLPIPKPALPYTRLPVQGATAQPVLDHISGNQQLQIVQAGMDGYIHVFNPDGTEVPGWPVKVALPSSFQIASGMFLLNDETLPTAPSIANLQQPGVPDIVERSQYTEISAGGITFGAKGIVFAYQPNGQLVPGWPTTMSGLAEYYGSAMGPITEGTDAPVSGPITTSPTPEGSIDQTIVNPVFTPAYLFGANGQVLSNYSPAGGSASPFTSTGALGVFGGQLTFAQSGVDVKSLIAAELSPNTGGAITKQEVAFPANGGGTSYSSGFPTSMQGLDFLGGPMFTDVTGNGQSSIIEGGDSSAIQGYQPGGTQAPGFPKFTSGWVIASPSSGDLFSNGGNELVATTREGYLFAWSTPGTASGNDQWWRWRHDEWNTADYGTDSRPPGVARNVSWAPGSPTLTFEAPGDNWYSGTVSHYNISLAPSGQILDVAPSGTAGTNQSVSIPPNTTGLTIQAVDGAGNLSQPVTVGATPPAPSSPGYLTLTAYAATAGFGPASTSGVPTGASSVPFNAAMVGIASTPDNKGYWEVAADGGVFAYGDAGFYGSIGGKPHNGLIVGIAATPDGKGYWLVGSDGGIFAFGDADFYGSASSAKLNGAIVSIASTPDGKGYWLVGSDGSVYTFGDAVSHGGSSGNAPYGSFTAIVATPDGGGYWLLTSQGNVLAYGDAVYFGSSAQTGALPPGAQAVAMVSTADGNGYWIFSSSGGVYSYGDAQFEGTPNVSGNGPVVGAS